MGRWRLPELLTRMRRLLDTKEIDAACVTLDQIEEEWDAIQERLHTLDVKCDSIGIALRDLMRGVW